MLREEFQWPPEKQLVELDDTCFACKCKLKIFERQLMSKLHLRFQRMSLQ